MEIPDTGLSQVRARLANGDPASLPLMRFWSATRGNTLSMTGELRTSEPFVPGWWKSVVPLRSGLVVELWEPPFLGDIEAALVAPGESGQRAVLDLEVPAAEVTLEAMVVDDRGSALHRVAAELDFEGMDPEPAWPPQPADARVRMAYLLRTGLEPPRATTLRLHAAGYRSATFDMDRVLTPGHHDLGRFRLEREPSAGPASRRAVVQVLIPSPSVLRYDHLRVAARSLDGGTMFWGSALRLESPGLAEAELDCPDGPFELLVKFAGRPLLHVGRFELPPGGLLELRGAEAVDARGEWRSVWLTVVDRSGRRVPWQGMWLGLDEPGLGGSLPDIGPGGRRIFLPKAAGRVLIGSTGRPAVVVEQDATRAQVVDSLPLQVEIATETGALPSGVRPVLSYRVLRDHWELPLDHPARWENSRMAWQIERSVVGPVLRGELHPGTELEVTVSLEQEGGGVGERVEVVTQKLVVDAGESESDLWRKVIEPGRDAVVRALGELGR